jgi:hypothetical protein
LADSTDIAPKGLKPVEVACFILIALIVITDGLHFVLHPDRNLRAVEVGGYEILIGAILAGFAAVYAISGTPANWEHVERSRTTILAYGMLIAYGLGLQHLGYFIATFLAVAAYMRLLGGYSIRISVVFSAAFAITSTWCWTAMLVNLPRGAFGTWLIW